MWHKSYISRGIQIPFNDAFRYGVSVERNFIPLGEPFFDVAVAHHLLPSENGGQQNLFLEAVDITGKRVPVTFQVTNINGTVSYPTTDKGPNEPATNVPIWMNDTLSVRVADSLSEVVKGIHTRHDDEPGGNQRGHHSFLIVFRYISGTLIPNPEPNPDPIKIFTPLEVDSIMNFPIDKIREMIK